MIADKLIKTILSNMVNLHTSHFHISKLDDNSKIVFPILFAGFTIVYWTYYVCTESNGGGEDNY